MILSTGLVRHLRLWTPGPIHTFLPSIFSTATDATRLQSVLFGKVLPLVQQNTESKVGTDYQPFSPCVCNDTLLIISIHSSIQQYSLRVAALSVLYIHACNQDSRALVFMLQPYSWRQGKGSALHSFSAISYYMYVCTMYFCYHGISLYLVTLLTCIKATIRWTTYLQHFKTRL